MEKRPQLVPTMALFCLLLSACSDNDSTPLTQHLTPATPATINICSDIATQFNFKDTVITSSEMVSAGKVEYSSTESYSAPDHCVVKGYMNERIGLGSSGEADTKYAIGFEMRLPKDWNGRFYYQANGGLDGSVSKAVGRLIFAGGADSAALNSGFAVISSDAGHPSPAPQFGFDPQARLDYGYNAVAELTPMAKSLIKIAYGKLPDRSYFAGCSNGGRHTMMAASRYAEMYDGFIVGNPGLHLPNAAVSQLYGAQQYSTLVTYNPDGSDILATLQTAITQEEFGVVSQQILKQCDALDGLADGMVNNTYTCQKEFDLDRDVPTCSEGRNGTCLSAEQKQVLSNIMAGPHNSQTGESLYMQTFHMM
ncbi:tannase/feruloyl esterase family alpha/beta hydrolase [Shewanella sp. Shew256]|uniref:tannase/feruloyl esterase family alpha/beta hydrolase n=1 Tax=Shewanella sp. Shew256 TaxID=1969376 RepID=UPI0020CECD0A|nr:tannase/feruloyl esterase family alpha/beta hydrolase [Shewanella sp. Shew256]